MLLWTVLKASGRYTDPLLVARVRHELSSSRGHLVGRPFHGFDAGLGEQRAQRCAPWCRDSQRSLAGSYRGWCCYQWRLTLPSPGSDLRTSLNREFQLLVSGHLMVNGNGR